MKLENKGQTERSAVRGGGVGNSWAVIGTSANAPSECFSIIFQSKFFFPDSLNQWEKYRRLLMSKSMSTSTSTSTSPPTKPVSSANQGNQRLQVSSGSRRDAADQRNAASMAVVAKGAVVDGPKRTKDPVLLVNFLKGTFPALVPRSIEEAFRTPQR